MTLRKFLLLDLPSGLMAAAAIIAWRLLVYSSMPPFFFF